MQETVDTPAAGRETRAFALDIRAMSDDGAIEGYGSVYGVKDSYGDVIVKGAFSESIKAHKSEGTMPAMLWQHDERDPIGVWTDMSEDDNGLHLKGRVAVETQRGKDALALLRMKAINGLSIGFVATKKSFDDKAGVRILSGIDLWEVSLVTFPANVKARVTSIKAADVAGITSIRQAEKPLRDAGFSDDAAKAYLASVKRIVLDERDARDATAKASAAASALLSRLKS